MGNALGSLSHSASPGAGQLPSGKGPLAASLAPDVPHLLFPRFPEGPHEISPHFFQDHRLVSLAGAPPGLVVAGGEAGAPAGPVPEDPAAATEHKRVCGPPVDEQGEGSAVITVGSVRVVAANDGRSEVSTDISVSAVHVEWCLDIGDTFLCADASRSPCGANMRLVSPVFLLTPPGGSEPLGLEGHMQHLMVTQGAGGSKPQLTAWRLMWAVFDHSDNDVSLYLTQVPTPRHEPAAAMIAAPPAVDMSIHPVAAPATAVTPVPVSATPTATGAEEAAQVSWEVVVEGVGGPRDVPDVRFHGRVDPHAYTRTASSWGLPGFLSPGQLDSLLAHTTLRVAVTLHPPGAAAHKDSATAPNAVNGSSAVVENRPDAAAMHHLPASLPASTTAAGDTHTATEVGSTAAAQPTAPITPPGSSCGVAGGADAKVSSITCGPYRPLKVDLSPLSDIEYTLASDTLLRPLPSDLRVLLASLSPRMLVVDGFLDARVCEALRELAAPRLVRSRVSTGTETPSRTSRGTFFTGDAARHTLLAGVEGRIEALLAHPAVSAGKRRLVKSEALQVVKYGVSDFYTEHYDNKAGGDVTRSATIIIYLNDCQEGGATFFPRSTGLPTPAGLPARLLDGALLAALSGVLHEDVRTVRPGLRVLPATGRALIFWSALPCGGEDMASLHAAEPVRAGEKWIATRWFKEV